jgi:hypothetical protein
VALSIDDQIERLKHTIAEMEAQRQTLGVETEEADTLVDAAVNLAYYLCPMRKALPVSCGSLKNAWKGLSK